MRKLQLLLFIGLFCCSFADKPKTQEKVNLTMAQTDSLKKIDDNQETQIIKRVSTSFYDWYLKRMNSLTDTVAYDYNIVKGENGKCKMDFEPYFNQLRQLKTISRKFMDKELKRTIGCVKHMETIEWSEYKDADAYAYEDSCPDSGQFYWVQSQEPYDGVEILDMKKNGNVWFTTLRLYQDYDNKREMNNSFFPVIKIENENGKWLMTEITFNEKK